MSDEPSRGDELFIWQEADQPGAWGTICTYVPVMNMAGPLVFRSRQHAHEVRPLAENHHRQTGKSVRLARFQLDEVEQTL